MEPAAPTTGIDAIYFRVQDMDRALKFYRSTLGLEPSVQSARSAEYVLADGSAFGIGILPESEAYMSPALMFAVPDVQAAVETLKGRGVNVVGEVGIGSVCTMAFIPDGEGNMLCLHQRTQTDEKETDHE